MTTILHGFPLSANTYRVRLLLNLLSVPHELRKVDLLQGEHKRPPFRALNPLGLVPVLEDQGRVLWDSHAILWYVAEKYGPAFLPPEARCEILQWLFFDATELHHGIGLARNHVTFRIPLEVGPVLTRARAALDVLNERLSARTFLELDRPTLADVACYPFIAVLSEAGLEPGEWPHVMAWAARIEALPGFVPMPRFSGFAR